MLLKDKVALITGAGSGIGRASAIRFANEGAKVMVADVRAETASNTAAEIEKAGGIARSLSVDVRVGAQVERMVNETIRVFGRLDILFNNAGVFVPKNVVDTSEEEWDWVVDVCLKGVFFGCKYAIPQMIKQGGGVIINTASGAGIEGVPNLRPQQHPLRVDLPRRYRDADRGELQHRPGRRIAAGVGAHRRDASARAQRQAGRGRRTRRVSGVGRGGVYHRYRGADRRRLQRGRFCPAVRA
jgi:NAD(P)-dependent dehydrogenase (short-subunit alcohol dehydrogenase family)